MKLIKHEPMYRFKCFEQPVTITTDDGDLIDTVLYFDKEPDSKMIDDAVVVVISRHDAIKNEPKLEPEKMLTVAEVEAVLIEKKVILPTEKWEDLKAKVVNNVKEQ